jgi:hypothetical protein
MSVHPLGTPAVRGLLRTRTARAIASGVVGLVLAATFAAPASADDTPAPTPPPALSDWDSVSGVTDSTPVVAPAASSASLAAPAALAGERETWERGGPVAWVTDTLQWFWSGSKMSSSSAWQADGFIFPNTVTLGGIKRTYTGSTEHLWRALATIGAGVVTPWGTVNVYAQTKTDYFALLPGGKLTHSEG